MSRQMSSGMLTAIQAGLLRPAVFVQAQFLTGTVFIWTGYGTITWNSQNWSGIGDLLSISTIEEGATVDARGILISLSGINNSLLADCLQEFQVGAPVVVYLGLFNNASPPGLIDTPVVSWAGRMDQATVDVGADQAIISIAVESKLLLNNVGVDRRYSADDSAILGSQDLSFRFVTSFYGQSLTWGRSPTAAIIPAPH